MKKSLTIFLSLFLCASNLYAWKPFGGGYKQQVSASDIETDTSDFDNNLSSSDTDIQTALETLDELAGGGGGSADAVTKSVNQSSHGFSVGDVLRLSSTTYVKAQADSAANAEVVGIVSEVDDSNNFTLTTHGRITGLSSLTAGTVYYLSESSAGDLTSTEPSGATDISKPILVADTTTSGYLINYRGLLDGGAFVAGDVTMVGDCADGDCLDGSSDGGTYIRLYDGDSHYGAFVTTNLSANRAYTFPNFDATMASLAGTETLTNKTLAAADNVIEADTGDSATSFFSTGTLEAARLPEAAADASTKGISTYTANDFDASSGVISLDYTNAQKASTSQAGFATELATVAETSAGTDTARVVTPDGLGGSIYGTKTLILKVATDNATAATTGDSKVCFVVPAELNGMDLVSVGCHVYTVSSSGLPTFQVRNQTDTQDMLSTKCTVDANEKDSTTAATAAVINTSLDDVVTGDEICVDKDVAGTGEKGDEVRLGFRIP